MVMVGTKPFSFFLCWPFLSPPYGSCLMKTLDGSPGSYDHLTTGAQLSNVKVLKLPAHGAQRAAGAPRQQSFRGSQFLTTDISEFRRFQFRRGFLHARISHCRSVEDPTAHIGATNRVNRRSEQLQ